MKTYTFKAGSTYGLKWQRGPGRAKEGDYIYLNKEGDQHILQPINHDTDIPGADYEVINIVPLRLFDDEILEVDLTDAEDEDIGVIVREV